MELTAEQIRNFRLRSHHLDRQYDRKKIMEAAGACGMQNTPPGAWEHAMYNRIPKLSKEAMEQYLYKERSLLQAWSFRGAPVVFPAADSAVFLSSLIPEGEEPWIYTAGITEALSFLQMDFTEILELLLQVIPRLDQAEILSKTALDQTLADWILPLLPKEKRLRWNQPSMYGSPDKQTVGGAAVSFLLRPCSFLGMVVFGERRGNSPVFTSARNWLGYIPEREACGKELVRRFLHCYGPSTADALASWLGCSGRQGRRLWSTVSEEIIPVSAEGKKAFLLSEDRERILTPVPLERELLLLGGHDPYLDQRDRTVLQPDRSLHRQIWRMVTNPGTVVYRGEIVGIWTSRKKGDGLEIRVSRWKEGGSREEIGCLAEEYASFRQLKLLQLEL